jgi:hypothetical protein
LVGHDMDAADSKECLMEREPFREAGGLDLGVAADGVHEHGDRDLSGGAPDAGLVLAHHIEGEEAGWGQAVG